jgi:hypothetical protein
LGTQALVSPVIGAALASPMKQNYARGVGLHQAPDSIQVGLET